MGPSRSAWRGGISHPERRPQASIGSLTAPRQHHLTIERKRAILAVWRWYAVHTHVAAEAKAASHLERQGFSVYLPRYLRRRSHARRIERVPRPLFPRYLFVSLNLEAPGWRAVRSTIGVLRLVSEGDHPLPLPERVIASVRAREDAAGMIALGDAAGLKSGDRVRIVDGPMADCVGLFDSATDQERVVVLLDLLGRQVRARVAATAVTACS